MSGNSAKRYGIEVEDPDLEARLRRMEVAIEKRQIANFQSQPTAQRRVRTQLPRVSGVRLDNSIIGGIAVRWNPVDANLDRYEVAISESPAFVGTVTTFKTNEPIYQFSELDPERTFYVRIRALGTRTVRGANDSGDWSAVLNTTTGQASFTNIEIGAASNITVSTQTSGFSPVQITEFIIGFYATTILDLPTEAEVILFGFIKADYNVASGTTLLFDLLVDGDVKQSYESRLDSAATAGRLSIPGLGFPQLLSAGHHRIEFRASMDGAAFVTPVEFTLAIWESRR